MWEDYAGYGRAARGRDQLAPLLSWNDRQDITLAGTLQRSSGQTPAPRSAADTSRAYDGGPVVRAGSPAQREHDDGPPPVPARPSLGRDDHHLLSQDLMRLNLMLLLFVSFLPFTTAIAATHLLIPVVNSFRVMRRG